MKILSFLILFTLCLVRVYSQSTLPLRADTIVVEKVGGNANFKLKDASRDSTGGIYTNIGGGVFRAIKTRKINDTLLKIGLDTFSVGTGGGAGGTGGGLIYIFSATAPTGADTAKVWIKTPAVAGVYNVFTYVTHNSWVRYGWLSIDGFFSPLPPINTVIAGQSNAAGSYSGGDTARVTGILGYTSGTANGGIDDPTHWEQATIGKSPFFNSNNNIAFAFAKNLRMKEQRIVRIIATYQGGVGLSAWLCGSPHYLLDTLRQRLSRSGIDTIHAFLWHHGESGGCAAGLSGGYYKDMQDLYDTLCTPATTGFIRNVTQFIAGELGGLDAANRNTLWPFTTPNGAIRKMNSDGNINTASVPSYGLERADDTHFSGTALDTLGLRYYGAYKDMPHTVAYEQRQLRGNFDTTYERLKYDEADYLQPAAGGGAMDKFYSGSFAWNINGFRTLSVNVDGSVNIANGHAIGGTNTNSRLRVGGRMSLSDGTNAVIATNFNPDNSGGGLQYNYIFADYTSNWTSSAGQSSVLIGTDAGYYTGRMPNFTVAIGYNAGKNFTPNGFGDYNTLIGTSAGASGLGSRNTVVGANAGTSMYTNDATVVGYGANGPGVGAYTAIGYNAVADSNYQVVLGDTNVTQLKIGKKRFKIDGGTPSNGDVYKYNSSTGIFELGAGASGGTLQDAITAGATLSSPNTIAAGGNAQTFTGTQSSAAAYNFANTGNGEALSATTTGSGAALSTANSGTGAGAAISSNTGHGINVTSTSGTLFRGIVNPSSTNTDVVTFRTIRQTTGTAAANMSQTWSQDLEDDAGNNISAVQHKSVWTSAAGGATSADYQLWTVGSGTLAQRFTIKPSGQVQFNVGYGSNTHTGTPVSSAQFDASGNVIEGPLVAAGTFTPTLTAVTNTSSPLLDGARYTRIGNIVTFSLRFSVTTSSGSSASSIRVTLPVASSFSNINQAAGTCSGSLGRVESDATNDELIVAWTSGAGGTETIVVTGQYTIL